LPVTRLFDHPFGDRHLAPGVVHLLHALPRGTTLVEGEGAAVIVGDQVQLLAGQFVERAPCILMTGERLRDKSRGGPRTV